MTVQELFETERTKKFHIVFGRYKSLIQKASVKGISPVAITFYKNRFLKEKNRLFSQKTDPKARYHWIENYYGHFLSLEGAAYKFDEKIKYIRKFVLKQYKEHDYLPSIMRFFGQDERIIITKMAHYSAYVEIERLFEEKNNLELRKKLRKNVPSSLSGAGKDDINVAYRKLFRGDAAYQKAESIIKEKYMDESKNWNGIDGKSQELPALVETLKEQNYIDYKSFSKAVTFFSERLKFHLADRTKRTKGKNFDDIKAEFKKTFPVFKLDHENAYPNSGKSFLKK